VADPDGRHASRRLAEAIRSGIAAGAYPPGARLPSYRQLRDEHHVALNTAQAAIRLLAADGLVEIRPAAGAFVRGDAGPGQRPSLRAELTDLQAALRRSRQDLAAAEEAVAGLLTRLPPAEPAQ
jgi:DNA-binding FadR family transcriptional regulator